MNILRYRKKAGLTQCQLAESVEVDQASVSNWERGINTPQRKMLPKIAKALGCTVDEILDEGDLISDAPTSY